MLAKMCAKKVRFWREMVKSFVKKCGDNEKKMMQDFAAKKVAKSHGKIGFAILEKSHRNSYIKSSKVTNKELAFL